MYDFQPKQRLFPKNRINHLVSVMVKGDVLFEERT
jgi:hypothetical protein